MVGVKSQEQGRLPKAGVPESCGSSEYTDSSVLLLWSLI